MSISRMVLLVGLVTLWSLPAQAQDGLVAHEWGSLIQVQGSSGFVVGGPREDLTEMPPFVLRWSTVPMQSRLMAPIRKPILYFYSDRARTITVKAGMPTGIYTEWWPPAHDFFPRRTNANQKIQPKNGWLLWRNIQVLRTRPASPTPRTAPRGSWYPMLRDVDAQWLRVRGSHYASAKNRGGKRFDELERFLLYRGVADHKAAVELVVRHVEGGKVELANTGRSGLGKVLLINVTGEKGWMKEVDAPAAGKKSTIMTEGTRSVPVSELQKTGIAAMIRMSTAAGLYEKEARGMSTIWGADWFRKTGFRVLYLIPRGKIDELIPLTITPKPKTTVRVLVGAIESITADKEAEIKTWIVQLGSRVWKNRERAKKALAKLGRMAGPLLRAALKSETDAERVARIEELIRLLQPTRRESE